ncbi:Hypothetical protein PHPALM_17985 [Phytophthora palmivora]|uniref:Uncharacterized protein n=1 Tax=Phytophthora palmivora TaxID=4796 RepID=A0A2P4XKV1_9STRA|nr:Hypothetical protein PHPALM_17985 [Phytophthora palmivora]
MDINGEKNWDGCAQYTETGMNWMERGERVRGPTSIDFVEGVGGFLLDVIGVWAFDMRNVFGQILRVAAGIIDGCTNEFLMGVDFMKKHKAHMDFDRNEIRYFDKDILVIIPFRTEDHSAGQAYVAAIRLAKRANLARNAVTLTTIVVAAPDKEQDIFVPTQNVGVVMLATTVTQAVGGTPAINMQSDRTNLPGKKELGVWIPLTEEMQVLELNGD